MLIEIIDKNLKPIGSIEEISSLQWKRRFVECGGFELHVPLNAKHLSLLEKITISLYVIMMKPVSSCIKN